MRGSESLWRGLGAAGAALLGAALGPAGILLLRYFTGRCVRCGGPKTSVESGGRGSG